MNDTERILLNIAIEASGSCHDRMERLQNGWTLRTIFDRPASQFMPLEMAKDLGMPLEKGDIVRCETNRSHQWAISKFIDYLGSNGAWGSDEYLCQKIGSTETCRVHNERISVLRFMPPNMLLYGKEKQIYDWCYKAFLKRYNKDADYFKRCGGVEIKPDKAIVWSRPHIWAQEEKGEEGKTLYAVPRKFEVSWDKKTRLKDIIAEMKKQGFAKKYEYAEKESTEGMGGCCKITKRDIDSVLAEVKL